MNDTGKGIRITLELTPDVAREIVRQAAMKRMMEDAKFIAMDEVDRFICRVAELVVQFVSDGGG